MCPGPGSSRGWQLSCLLRTPFIGISQESMLAEKEQPLPITGALAGGGVTLTFLFWINIFWDLTLPGTQLRSYQASGLAARALLLPQTRASRHSCPAYPHGPTSCPGADWGQCLTPFSAMLFSCSGCPLCPLWYPCLLCRLPFSFF